jgi:hypothetical protein
MTDYDGIRKAYKAEYDYFDVDEFFGYSFVRTASAYNGNGKGKAVVISTHKAAIPSYIFRESDRATKLGAWA